MRLNSVVTVMIPQVQNSNSRRALVQVDEVVRQNVRFLRAQHLAASGDNSAVWSQGAVAERLGMSRPTYVNIETARRSMTIHDLLALAWVYDVSPQRLLTPPAYVESVTLGQSVAVTGAAFQGWIRGLEPLPGQDAQFFGAHERDRTPEGVSADGRRQVDPGITRGVPEREEVLEAHRALDGLLRALLGSDADSIEVYQDLLDQAVRAAASSASEAATGQTNASGDAHEATDGVVR